MDKTEHRLDKLEEGTADVIASTKKDFERITADLADTCGTLREYNVKLDNLWQWKLHQNGILTDIRNDQRDMVKALNWLWLKIVGSVIVALIVNFFIAK